MQNLKDDSPVSHLSIPGTHDTGTYPCKYEMECSVYQCQYFDIYQQLVNGIRYLDLRVNSENPLTIGHKDVEFVTLR